MIIFHMRSMTDWFNNPRSLWGSSGFPARVILHSRLDGQNVACVSAIPESLSQCEQYGLENWILKPPIRWMERQMRVNGWWEMIPELQTSAESHCWRAEPRPSPEPPRVYRPGLRSQMINREQLLLWRCWKYTWFYSNVRLFWLWMENSLVHSIF